MGLMRMSNAERAQARDIPQPVRTTRIVKILDIVPGDPPSILVFERTRVKGKKRSFTQEVKVTDDQLFQRLLAEAGRGDYIEAIIVTEFAEQGYSTYLTDFSKQSRRLDEQEEGI